MYVATLDPFDDDENDRISLDPKLRDLIEEPIMSIVKAVVLGDYKHDPEDLALALPELLQQEILRHFYSGSGDIH